VKLKFSTELAQPDTLAPSHEDNHTSSCPVSLGILGGREPWGLDHGYLIEMGALKFKLEEGDPKYPTDKGIQKLAELDMSPTVSFLNKKVEYQSNRDRSTGIIMWKR
jgi:hypothetical protein